jgi:hypothetical protein
MEHHDFLLLIQYYVDQIKENEMGRLCDRYERTEMQTGFWWRSLKEEAA